MKTWKLVLLSMLPMLEIAAHHFRNQDENDYGTDDVTGISLQYICDLAKALVNGTRVPKAPDILVFGEGKGK